MNHCYFAYLTLDAISMCTYPDLWVVGVVVVVVVVVVVEVVVSYMLGRDSDMYTFIEFNDAKYVKNTYTESVFPPFFSHRLRHLLPVWIWRLSEENVRRRVGTGPWIAHHGCFDRYLCVYI